MARRNQSSRRTKRVKPDVFLEDDFFDDDIEEVKPKRKKRGKISDEQLIEVVHSSFRLGQEVADFVFDLVRIFR